MKKKKKSGTFKRKAIGIAVSAAAAVTCRMITGESALCAGSKLDRQVLQGTPYYQYCGRK